LFDVALAISDPVRQHDDAYAVDDKRLVAHIPRISNVFILENRVSF
jgi:hypothetical protein